MHHGRNHKRRAAITASGPQPIDSGMTPFERNFLFVSDELAPFTEADRQLVLNWHRRMTPGEIGKDLRAKGFVPEFVDDEPRHYLSWRDSRTYIEEYS